MEKVKVLLAVTGGIAVYKVVDLASQLIKNNFEVKVIMTENAARFVTPLTFSSIIHNNVHIDGFDHNDPIKHIDLADWCDIMIIAPATANLLAKAAHGIADDLLTSTLLATTVPKVVFPAMNVHMFENPAVQNNLEIIKSYGFHILPPESGILACGYKGKGRLPKTEEMLKFMKNILHTEKKDFSGIKVLVTAGACREHIDPMRFLTNHSSGKMGLALSRALYSRGAQVHLVHAHVTENIPEYIHSQKAETAEEMFNAVKEVDYDIAIKSAAVTDYTFERYSEEKIKKSGDMTLNLVRTQDILKYLGKNKGERFLVGFAAESENIIENARKKISSKNLDLIVANNISVSGSNNTEVFVVSKDTETKYLGSKDHAANMILDNIIEMYNRKKDE